MQHDRPSSRRTAARGITIVEILAVVGIIAVLLAILLPSLSMVRGKAVLGQNLKHLRQVGQYMEAYSKDNRETVVPSAFDYSALANPGKVRSNKKSDGTEPPPPAGLLRMGTWADILWSNAELGPIVNDSGYDYRYDAPDGSLYLVDPDFERNPLRSTSTITREFTGNMSTDAAINNNDLGSRVLPEHVGQPGVFAANNFFDSRTGNWFTTGQVRRPAQSLYLVDSLAGETIDSVDNASGLKPWWGSDPQCQIDFRYVGGVAAMLLMDGHTETQPKWDTLEDLQGVAATPNDHGRGVRVTQLDQR